MTNSTLAARQAPATLFVSSPIAPVQDADGLDDLRAITNMAVVDHVRVNPYLPGPLADEITNHINAKCPVFPRQAAAEASLNALPGHPLETLQRTFARDTLTSEANAIDSPALASLGFRAMLNEADSLRASLANDLDLPNSLCSQLVSHGCERALSLLRFPSSDDSDLQIAIAELNTRKALTPTLLLRWLRQGSRIYFDAGLAELGRLDSGSVARATWQDSPDRFASIYKQAKLPATLYRAFRGAIDVVSAYANGQGWNSGQVGREVVGRWMHDYEQIGPERWEHVITQLSRCTEQALHLGPDTPVSATP